jgi:hypothetical protein
MALPRHRNLFVRSGYNPYKQCAPPALLSVNRESRDIAQQTFRLCVLSDDMSRRAVYININQGFDYLYTIQWTRVFRAVVEASVKDRALLKGPGSEFRYSRKTMDIHMSNKPALLARPYLSRRIPKKFWQDFLDCFEEKKYKTWARVAGRLTSVSGKNVNGLSIPK